MNTNPATVPERRFQRPLTWASDSQLQTMHQELTNELLSVHPSVWAEAKQRNGWIDIDREIRWRQK